ncbi:MAG TPA: hypothetical protein VK253_07735 [Candidatus Binatia bacterium]|nr:hypothetical protein [Candidatus Binatia bacterium]
MAASSDNSTDKECNTSYNSYLARKSWSAEARVFHIIDASEIELRPAEIARKLHAPKKPTPGQYTSVRVFCRKLLEKGKILQPYLGAYCNKITYGVRFVPLAVHNISLRSFVCEDVKSWEKDEFIGGVKIHVCFGSERRKISGYIACDIGGMSHDACLLALNRWFDIVQDHLGWQLNDLQILTFECNKDYRGIRIDSVLCVTKTDLFGMIERVYQKEENLVRKEQKTVTPMSVNKFEEAISKGFNDSVNAHANFEIKQEVKGNSEALKYANSRLLSVERLLEALYKHRISEGDKTKNLEAEVSVLRCDIEKLTATLVSAFNLEGVKDQANTGSGGNKYVS